MDPETYESLIIKLLEYNKIANTFEIYEFIESSMKGVKTREMEGIDWKKSVRGIIRLMEKKGKLKRVARGRYQLLKLDHANSYNIKNEA